MTVQRGELRPANSPPQALDIPVTQKVLGGTATPEPCWLPVQISALESVQRFMPEVSKLCPRPLPQSLLTVGCRDSAEHPAEEVREGQVLDQDMLDRCVAGQPPGFGGCHRDDPPDAGCPARILPVEQDDVADLDVLSLGRPQQAVVGHEDHHGKLNLLLDPDPHCHSHCRSGGHWRTELGRHRQMEGPHQPPHGCQCGTHIGHRPASELEEEQ